MIIVAIVLLVALLIVCTRFPSLQSDDHSDSAQSTFFASLTRLMRIRHWRWAYWPSSATSARKPPAGAT